MWTPESSSCYLQLVILSLGWGIGKTSSCRSPTYNVISPNVKLVFLGLLFGVFLCVHMLLLEGVTYHRNSHPLGVVFPVFSKKLNFCFYLSFEPSVITWWMSFCFKVCWFQEGCLKCSVWQSTLSSDQAAKLKSAILYVLTFRHFLLSLS